MQLMAASPKCRRKQVSWRAQVGCYLKLVKRLACYIALQAWEEQMRTEHEQQIKKARSIAAHMRMCSEVGSRGTRDVGTLHSQRRLSAFL